MARYFVTGAGGFVGSKTCELLLARGDQVLGFDNLNDYYCPELKRRRLDDLSLRTGFQFLEGDVEDLGALRTAVSEERVDAILNLAARAGVRASMENPRIYLTTNALGMLNVLELAREFGIGKIVLASTSSLYSGQPSPFSEDAPTNSPLSPYAASKKAAEAIAYSYYHLYGLSTTVLRYFTVYGPVGRPDMAMFRFVRNIMEGEPIEVYGDGEQTRDFTYVDDIAAGTVASLEVGGYEIVNLGGGAAPVSVNQIIAWIEEFTGQKATVCWRDPIPADMPSTSADVSKAMRLLSWKPGVSTREGVQRTVDWHMANREWIRNIAI